MAGLLVGSYGAAEDSARLRAAGITHVVCLTDGEPLWPQGLASMHVPMSDWGDSSLSDLVAKAAPFIDEARSAGGRVLVFCMLGVNRSPALVAGYLVAKGWKLGDALEAVSSARPVVSIHDGYMAQLRRLSFGRTIVPRADR
jgi:protein-tyrosine phosphatase